MLKENYAGEKKMKIVISGHIDRQNGLKAKYTNILGLQKPYRLVLERHVKFILKKVVTETEEDTISVSLLSLGKILKHSTQQIHCDGR